VRARPVKEVAREAPAALRGHPEISLGNVIGSVLAFFLMNAGIIALVRPIPMDVAVLRFHLPMAIGTTVFIAGMVATTRRLPRWAGVALLFTYGVFVAGSYLTGSRGAGG
jgi:cation:H+ antiporter